MYKTCLVCEAKVKEMDYLEVYVSDFNNQEYKLYECSQCKVQWWEPLKMIPEFYEKEGLEEYTLFHIGIRKLPIWCQPFFKYFPRDKKGYLLDIGCGDGIFLYHASLSGFKVYGIDIDQKSIKIAKEKRDIANVFNMSLEEFIEREKLVFDVITFFEVLEHQDKPKHFLNTVWKLLRPGGLIAGSVPNRDSYFMIESRKFSKGDFPPHHFLRFSKEALYNTLQSVGFKDIEIYELDYPFNQLIPFIEKKLFGNLDNLKQKLKAMSSPEKEEIKYMPVEDIEKVSDNKLYPLFLKTLKMCRNIVLLPFTIFYLRKLKGNGLSLYFQARKS